MSAEVTSVERVRHEPIKAVAVRRPGRWAAIAVLAVLVAMFVHLLVTNEHFEWSFVLSDQVMFSTPVLEGLRGTILLTVFAMLIGVSLGIVLAVMRLSDNPILSNVAFVYTWFFRRCRGWGRPSCSATWASCGRGAGAARPSAARS